MRPTPFDEGRLMQLGRTLEDALGTVNTIVRYPELIIDVKFTDGVEDEKHEVFKTEGTNKVLTLKIFYEDDGRIAASKKQQLDEMEANLERELEEIKKSKSKL